MADGVLIDTSFLITLSDRQRTNHDAARRYWRHFLENDIPIYLSTIVVSEFCVRQEIPPEMLRACMVLPFNWDNAQRTAQLYNRTYTRPPEQSRVAFKDDLKLIAQAAIAEAEFVITDDTRTFYSFCQSFRELGEVEFTAIKLEDGFDSSFFEPNDQKSLFDTLEDKEDAQE